MTLYNEILFISTQRSAAMLTALIAQVEYGDFDKESSMLPKINPSRCSSQKLQMTSSQNNFSYGGPIERGYQSSMMSMKLINENDTVDIESHVNSHKSYARSFRNNEGGNNLSLRHHHNNGSSIIGPSHPLGSRMGSLQSLPGTAQKALDLSRSGRSSQHHQNRNSFQKILKNPNFLGGNSNFHSSIDQPNFGLSTLTPSRQRLTEMLGNRNQYFIYASIALGVSEYQKMTQEYDKTIYKFHKSLQGFSRYEAIRLFLKNCLALPMYGMRKFPLSSNKSLFLGLCPAGIELYEVSPGLNLSGLHEARERVNNLNNCNSSGQQQHKVLSRQRSKSQNDLVMNQTYESKKDVLNRGRELVSEIGVTQPFKIKEDK